MAEFRLTQISDTHLSPHHAELTQNFDRVRDHIDATRPDLVVNSGDLAFDAPTNPGEFEYAKSLHEALPVPCRYLPGNHDIGDNPTWISPQPSHPVNEDARQAYIAAFGEDRWHFEAAGWCLIGLNSMVMNSRLASEDEQFDWLAGELARTGGKPVALFLHKPLFLNTPEDPELSGSSTRYVPMAARRRLVEMLGAVDLRLIASGHLHQRRDFTFGPTRHVWSPSTGFIVPNRLQEPIGIKEVGFVEYRFKPDAFEVRHIRVPGQLDVDMDELLAKASTSAGGKG
jgi:3',5'-cyclic AMP phosphodiesterase CpdA